jgi:hypothetical protein
MLYELVEEYLPPENPLFTACDHISRVYFARSVFCTVIATLSHFVNLLLNFQKRTPKKEYFSLCLYRERRDRDAIIGTTSYCLPFPFGSSCFG